MALKSDQENPIMDVLSNVAKRRSADSKPELLEGRGVQSAGPQGRAIPEASPVSSSGSNGAIERAVQAIDRQARTIKLALESRIGSEIPSDHDVAPWIIEYAATIISKCQVGAGGETAYERFKGKPARLSGRGVWRESPVEGHRSSKGKAE